MKIKFLLAACFTSLIAEAGSEYTLQVTPSSLQRSHSEIPFPRDTQVPVTRTRTRTIDGEIFTGPLGRSASHNPITRDFLDNIQPEAEVVHNITEANWDHTVQRLLQMARGHIPFNRELLNQAQAFIDNRGWQSWRDAERVGQMDHLRRAYPALALFVTDRQGNTLLGLAAQKQKDRTKEQKQIQRQMMGALNHLSENKVEEGIRDGLIHFLRHDDLQGSLDALKGVRKGVLHNKNAHANHLLRRATEMGLSDVVLSIYMHLKSLGASEAHFQDLLSYRGKKDSGGALTLADRQLESINNALQNAQGYDTSTLKAQQLSYQRIVAIFNAMQSGTDLAEDFWNAVLDEPRGDVNVVEEDSPRPNSEYRIPILTESLDSADLNEEGDMIIQTFAHLPANFQEGAVWENPGEGLDWAAFIHEVQRFIDGQQGMTPEAALWFLKMQKHFEKNRRDLPEHLQVFLAGPHAARMIFEWPLAEDGASFFSQLIPDYGRRTYNDPLVDAYWAQALGIRKMIENPTARLGGLKLINLIQKINASLDANERFEALVHFDNEVAQDGGLGAVLAHVLNWGSAIDDMHRNETADVLVATIIWQGMHTPSLTKEQKRLKVQWTLQALQAAADDNDNLERLFLLLPPGWENFDEELLNAKLDHDMPGHSSAQLVAKKLLKKLSEEQRERILNMNKALQKVAPVVDVVVNSEVTNQAVRYFCPGFEYVLLPIKWVWRLWNGAPQEAEKPKQYKFGQGNFNA